jgi:hypothetical protein
MADLTYQAKLEGLVRGRAGGGPNIFVNGYFQYYHGLSYARDAVCWAMQPDAPTQTSVREYFEQVRLGDLTTSPGLARSLHARCDRVLHGRTINCAVCV